MEVHLKNTIETLQDSAIPRLGTNLEKIKNLKDTGTPEILAPQGSIDKAGKQANQKSQLNGYMIGYTYIMQYFSTTKKQEILLSPASGKKLEMIIPSEVRKTRTDMCHMISLLGVIEKCIQMNFITKEKQLHRLRKRNLQLPKKKCGGCAGSKELVQNNNTPYKHLIHLINTLYTLEQQLLLSHSVLSDSLQSHELQPVRLLCPWDFPGKPIGVGYHFLLQGILLTQGLNPYLLLVSCIAGRFFTIEPAGNPLNRC